MCLLASVFLKIKKEKKSSNADACQNIPSSGKSTGPTWNKPMHLMSKITSQDAVIGMNLKFK